MHRAVYASDKPRLEAFMQARPQGLKQADHHGNTPLLLALKLGRTEMAWLMVRAGAELDVPSDGSFHLLVSFFSVCRSLPEGVPGSGVGRSSQGRGSGVHRQQLHPISPCMVEAQDQVQWGGAMQCRLSSPVVRYSASKIHGDTAARTLRRRAH